MKIFKKADEARRVIEIFESKFDMNLFPRSISKSDSLKFIFIDSILFKLEYCIKQFYHFLDKVNVEAYYFLPAESLEYNWKDYEKEHLFNKKTKYALTPAFLLDGRPDDESINEWKSKYPSIDYIEYFVFSKELDWVIQYVPYRNLMILYYEENISSSIQVFGDDIIKDLDSLIEIASWGDGFNKVEIENLKSFWLPKLESFKNKL